MKRTKGVGPQGLGVSPFKEVDVPEVESVDPNVPVDPNVGEATPPVDPFMEEFNRYQTAGQDGSNPDGTEKSSMMQGEAIDEIVVDAGPRKKTRAEHRLDKTQSKGEAAAEAGNYNKANRLQRRKQRLQNKVERQEGKDKKRYARKDKKYWRDQKENN